MFKYQFAKALEFHQAAVAKDPDYPLAYTGLATDYIALAVTTANREEMLKKAMEAANKALALDANLDEAHNALGFVKFLGNWDWAGAEQELRRAIELNPKNADARQNYCDLLSVLGRREEALDQIERARQLDPISDTILNSYASALFYARRYEQALEKCQMTLELDPQHRGASTLLPRIYLAQSKFDQAIAESKKRMGDTSAFSTLITAYANARLGRRADAESAIQLFKRTGESSSSHMIAMIYAGLNDKDRAFEWLERAFEARSNKLITLKVDAEWDNLRPDPRFDDLLRRMRLKA